MVAALRQRTRAGRLLRAAAALAALGLLMPLFASPVAAAPGETQPGVGSVAGKTPSNENAGHVDGPAGGVINSGEDPEYAPSQTAAEPGTTQTTKPPTGTPPASTPPGDKKSEYVRVPLLKEPILRTTYEKWKKEDEEAKSKACKPGVTNAVSNHLSVSCMTEEAVKSIFGMPKDQLSGKGVLTGILRFPTFVDSPGHEIGDAEWLTQGIAFALLLVMVTFTGLHYLGAGFLSSGNGGSILDGAMRCAGAGVLILAWPFLYVNAVHVTDAVTIALLPEGSVDTAMAALLAAGGATAGIGIGILIMILFGLLLLGLLMIKIGLLVGMLMAFVGMPLALALWPVPSLSAPAAYAFRYIGMSLTVVVMWAICFHIFAAVNAEFRAENGLGTSEALLLPLLGIGELLALLAVPRHAVAMWNVAPRKGTIGSVAQFAASNIISSQLGKLGKLLSKSKPIKPPPGGGQPKPPPPPPPPAPPSGGASPRSPKALPSGPTNPSPVGGGPGALGPAAAEAEGGGEEPKKVKLGLGVAGGEGLAPPYKGRKSDLVPAARATKRPASARGAGRKPSTRPAGGRPGGRGDSRGPGRSRPSTGGTRFDQPPRVKDGVGAAAGGSSSGGSSSGGSPATRGVSPGPAGPPPASRDSSEPSRPPTSTPPEQSPPPSND